MPDKQTPGSVWTRPQRRRPDQPPALSRDQIVAAAIDLLDADGLEALSMRKLGTRLGAAATSIYWHVANKDELIELVVDEVYGELRPPVADDPRGWRTAIADCAGDLRAAILRHPWMAAVLGQVGLAYLGPNVARLSEGMLATFQAGGFTGEEANLAGKTLIAYVLGMAGSEGAYLSMLARSGQSEEEWAATVMPTAEETAGAHPHLSEQYAAQRLRDPKRIRDETFEYGLERFLDGVAARLAR